MARRHASGTALLLLVACQSVQPMPPEIIEETFAEHPAGGTPEVWDELWQQVESDGLHRAALLERGDEALLLRLNLIRSARKSIRIQTFHWFNDESGRLVMWELLKAVTQRGVEVDLMADEAFLDVEPRILAALSTLDPRLRMRLYNPSGKRMDPGLLRVIQNAAIDPRKINIRMHNKLLLVDDRFAIVGGRNYSNKYFDRVIGLNFKDRDVLVAGPEARVAGQSFLEYWNHPWAVPVQDLLDIQKAHQAGDDTLGRTGTEFAFHHLFHQVLREAADPITIRQWLDRNIHVVQGVRFLADLPEKNDTGGFEGGGRLTQALIDLIQGAETDVTIQSPYLALSDRALGVFRELRRQRPDLRILVSTNSLAATDSWQTYAYSHKQKRIYLQDLGFEIWEFMPVPQDIHRMMDYTTLLERRPTPDEVEEMGSDPFYLDSRLRPFEVTEADGVTRLVEQRRNTHTGGIPFLCLHQKSVVVDGRHSFVGSYNFDPRSGNLNTELGFLIDDPVFADTLLRNIRRDTTPENSFRIAEREHPQAVTGLVELAQKTSEVSPVDLWPFRRTASFRLRPGHEAVPPGHPDFFQHWRSMGSFPLLGALSEKVICARLLKTFGAPLSPLVRVEQALPEVAPVVAGLPAH